MTSTANEALVGCDSPNGSCSFEDVNENFTPSMTSKRHQTELVDLDPTESDLVDIQKDFVLSYPTRCTPLRTTLRTSHCSSGSVSRLRQPSLTLPPSPLLQTLGFGTGVTVFLLPRSPNAKSYRSPWALKKYNRVYKNRALTNARLRHEAEVLRTLVHPNIVGFRAAWDTPEGDAALALQAAGIALMVLIEERAKAHRGPFETVDCVAAMSQLGNGLTYLHGQRVLHGDIKSSNVLVQQLDSNSSGQLEQLSCCQLRLCDLGTALHLDEELIMLTGQHYTGTAAWMAWEALDGDSTTNVSDRTDMFALGMTLYELLALCVPHSDKFPEEWPDELGPVDEDVYLDAYYSALGHRPNLPECMDAAQWATPIALFLALTEDVPAQRPSATQLVTLLQPQQLLCCDRTSDASPVPLVKQLALNDL